MQTATSTLKQHPPGFFAKVALEFIATSSPVESVYLRQYRISGPKPWGGGKVTAQYSVRKLPILEAVSAAKARPHPHTLELTVWKSASAKTSIMLDGQAVFGAAPRENDGLALVVCIPVSVNDLERAFE